MRQTLGGVGVGGVAVGGAVVDVAAASGVAQYWVSCRVRQKFGGIVVGSGGELRKGASHVRTPQKLNVKDPTSL